MHEYLIPLAFLITFVFILVKKPKKVINLNIPTGRIQNEQYMQGFIRATEIIRNGSDAEEILKVSNNSFTDYSIGWRDACMNYITTKNNENIQKTVDQYQVSLQQNEILARHRTGISKQDEELLNTQS